MKWGASTLSKREELEAEAAAELGSQLLAGQWSEAALHHELETSLMDMQKLKEVDLYQAHQLLSRLRVLSGDGGACGGLNKAASTDKSNGGTFIAPRSNAQHTTNLLSSRTRLAAAKWLLCFSYLHTPSRLHGLDEPPYDKFVCPLCAEDGRLQEKAAAYAETSIKASKSNEMKKRVDDNATERVEQAPVYGSRREVMEMAWKLLDVAPFSVTPRIACAGEGERGESSSYPSAHTRAHEDEQQEDEDEVASMLQLKLAQGLRSLKRMELVLSCLLARSERLSNLMVKYALTATSVLGKW